MRLTCLEDFGIINGYTDGSRSCPRSKKAAESLNEVQNRPTIFEIFPAPPPPPPPVGPLSVLCDEAASKKEGDVLRYRIISQLSQTMLHHVRSCPSQQRLGRHIPTQQRLPNRFSKLT